MGTNRKLIDLSAVTSFGLCPCEVPGLGSGISIEAGRASPKEWASILQNFRDANLYQTRPYASVRWGEKRLGHVVLRCSGEIAAAAQVILAQRRQPIGAEEGLPGQGEEAGHWVVRGPREGAGEQGGDA